MPISNPITGSWLEERAEELTASIVFSTRLPFMRATPTGASALAKAAWAFPIAGILIGVIGAAVYGLAHKFGVPAWPAAALAVTATLLATGGLHEDGLADTVDGFGGGTSRELKLDIMRDSHIGAYGVCALVLSLLLRVSVLASLPSAHAVVWALIAAHGGARAAMMAFMFLLPPARSDGLSFDAGRPPGDSVAAVGALGFLILAICLHPRRAILALFLLLVVIAVMAWLSSKEIEGQTGDVLGAVEQVSEIAILLVALG
jgi:adenosylcobinamide-GDP ribazoletransferase